MKDLFETRRSVRSYKPDHVSEALTDQVIEAGLYAPSGRGTQSAVVVAVTNERERADLSRLNAEIMGVSGDPFYGAPVVLVVLADRNVPTHVYDGSLVMGNMMLKAHELGLGSCWIHRAREEFDSVEGKMLLQRWGIEGDYEGIGHCILGYPAEELPQAAPRREGRKFYVR